MIWFFLSLSTAVFEATKDLFSKKGLREIDEYLVAWGLRAFALPFLLPLLFFIPIPKVTSQFWWALFIGGGLNALTSILYMKAIKISPLSLTVPMLTFTPLFLLLTSPIILGEFPGIFGIIGVLLIVFGSYLLNIQVMKNGYLAPFKALIKEKGPILMLIVAFIWSITSNIDKIGVLNSSPIFWAISINIFLFFTLLFIVSLKSKVNLKRQILQNTKVLFPIGLFSALALICQMTAIKMALVAFVISIKRTSTIFSSLYGFFIFKEPFLKLRLVGILIMVLGVFLIALF